MKKQAEGTGLRCVIRSSSYSSKRVNQVSNWKLNAVTPKLQLAMAVTVNINFADKIPKCANKKAFERFPFVLFDMLHKMVFESSDKIRNCDHSYKSY